MAEPALIVATFASSLLGFAPPTRKPSLEFLEGSFYGAFPTLPNSAKLPSLQLEGEFHFADNAIPAHLLADDGQARLRSHLERLEFNSEGDALRAIQDARTILEDMPAGVPLPSVIQSESGVLALVWRDDAFYADLQFEGDGLFHAYLRRYFRNGDKQSDGIEAMEVANGWNDDLSSFLSVLAPNVLSQPLAA